LRIGLYLPDDKKELYEEAKKRLEKEGRSVSQLFLEALEKYMSSQKNVLSEKEVLMQFRQVIDSLSQSLGISNLEVTEEKLGKYRPDAVIKLNDKIIGIVEIKKTPMKKVKLDVKDLEECEYFNHSPIIKPYIPLLVKQEIPLFFIIYTDKDGEPVKLDIIDVFDFEKSSITVNSRFPDIEKDMPFLLKAKSLIEWKLEDTISYLSKKENKG